MIDHNKCPSSKKSAEKSILRKSFFHHSEPSHSHHKYIIKILWINQSHLGPLDPAVLDEGVPAHLHRHLLGRRAVFDEAALPVNGKLVRNGNIVTILPKVYKVCVTCNSSDARTQELGWYFNWMALSDQSDQMENLFSAEPLYSLLHMSMFRISNRYNIQKSSGF